MNLLVLPPPDQLFGGTWEEFGKGQVLVGVDSSQTEFSTVQKSGGEKEHTLTREEMPSHTHIQDPHKHTLYTSTGSQAAYFFNPGGAKASYQPYANTTSTTATNQYTGGSQAHNNLQPYITVYRWIRTA